MTLDRQRASSQTGYHLVRGFEIPKGETMCPGGYLELYIHYREDRASPGGPHAPHNQFINAGHGCSYCSTKAPKRRKLKKYM